MALVIQVSERNRSHRGKSADDGLWANEEVEIFLMQSEAARATLYVIYLTVTVIIC